MLRIRPLRQVLSDALRAARKGQASANFVKRLRSSSGETVCCLFDRGKGVCDGWPIIAFGRR